MTNTDRVAEYIEAAILRAERAQQIAHDPTRWKTVCNHLAEVRMLLARMLDEVAPDRHRTPPTVRATPLLFEGKDDE